MTATHGYSFLKAPELGLYVDSDGETREMVLVCLNNPGTRYIEHSKSYNT